MTPAQHAAYETVCAADPECRCPLVFYMPPEGESCENWSGVGGGLIHSTLAAAAITDHLNTRLEQDSALDGSVEWDGALWCFMSFEVAAHPPRLTSKLSAYLAAHIVRLGLDRSLITAMEEAA